MTFHQVVDLLQENKRAIDKLTKDMEDVKRRLSRLNLSSCVFTHPPMGQIDLTPCLKPQAPVPTEQPTSQ